MGTYTKFSANMVIDTNNQQVVEIIESLMNPRDYFGEAKFHRPETGMLHEFFACDRATCIFADMDSAFSRLYCYYPEEVKKIHEEYPHAGITEDDLYYGIFDTVVLERSTFNPETGNLIIRSSLKNYDNEIQKFLDWIKPYCVYSNVQEIFEFS